MPELHIPFDPLNPGHFFACCGLFECCCRAQPAATASFTASESAPRRAGMLIHTPAPVDLRAILTTLRDAVCEPVAEGERAVRPIRMEFNGQTVVLDWWLDFFRQETTPFKCWAGQVTSGKLFTDLPALIDPDTPAEELFYRPALTRSKLGIDPRSAWNALDFGFSPDKHNRDTATYPIVEVLGALGLQTFRPVAARRGSIAYHLWCVPLPLNVARLAAIAPWPGLPLFRYEFSIGKRGQSYKFFTFASLAERISDS